MKKGKNYFWIALGFLVLISVVVLIINNSPKENITYKNQSSPEVIPVGANAVLYKPKYIFSNFTDPKENAFTIKIPEEWEVSSESGLIRPYIDAGILMQANSNNAGFFYLTPYGVYTVPNDILTYAGFSEGTYYDPSNGLSKPMLVKKYTESRDFLNEYIKTLNVETKVIEVVDRPDLTTNSNSLITKQSASEMTYISNSGEITNKIIAYTYLVETSGIGVWSASLFGYYSPKSLFNETEYLVLKSAETFKVNPDWAAREAQEMNKRMKIISSTSNSISDTVSSTFNYRTNSQDRINNEWSKTTLGIEEVYNSQTGSSDFVGSGSNYYWADNRNNIYGTETDESPFPQEDMTKLEIKKEV
ncbi:MAG: hypothetical protein AABX99_00770 [Nanoarchaeota archaeon]